MSKLPDKTRAYLAYLAEKARDGFTGRIVIDFNQGGIGNFEETKRPKLDDVQEYNSCARRRG